MQAYHNKQELKHNYIARIKSHIERGALQQVGATATWNPMKKEGNFVGCILESVVYSEFPKQLGIPVELAYAAERIFMGLPLTEARELAYAFLKAIPTGADLSLVWYKLAYWVLTTLVSFPESAFKERKREEEIYHVYNEITHLYLDTLGGIVHRKSAWLQAVEDVQALGTDKAEESLVILLEAAAGAGMELKHRATQVIHFSAEYNNDSLTEKIGDDRIQMRYKRIQDKLLQLLVETA